MENQTATLQNVIAELEILFSKMNDHFFNGELEKPIISVSPDTTKGAYGWFTPYRAWKNDSQGDKEHEGYYEINLCAEHLTRPLHDVAGTLLHEMVHQKNEQDGVKDCSRGNTYHNNKFKKAAETYGLNVIEHDKYGWCITSLNDESKKIVDSMGLKGFSISRIKVMKTKSKKSKSLKYVCPECRCSVRATKPVKIGCLACDVDMICVNLDEDDS